jgi:hypothetical protein
MQTTLIAWWREPQYLLPNTGVFVSADGEAVSIGLRTSSLPPVSMWDPSFGPGLSLGGLESAFIAAGLIDPSDRTETGESREYRYEHYQLEFSRDGVTDDRGDPIPGWRLTRLEIYF